MIKLFNRYWAVPTVVSLAVEAVLLLFSVWVAYRLRFFDEMGSAFFYSGFPLRAGVFSAAILLNLYINGLYDSHERLGVRQLGVRLLRSFFSASILLLVVYYITYPALTTGRGVFAISISLSAVLLTTWRLGLRWSLSKSVFSERVLIVGADESAQDLAREIIGRDHLGYRVIGFLDDDPSLQGMSLINPRVIGTTSQAAEISIDLQASAVVVARDNKRGQIDMDSLLECKTSGIPVYEGSTYYEKLTGKIALEGLRKSWLIFSSGFVVSTSDLMAKRLLDLVAATIGLIIALPVIVIVALAIRLDSRGPVLYCQKRVGRNGEIFKLIKFRSMREDAEVGGDAVWARENDDRVTRVGRAIRKTRLDEIPQLFNVLIGDMSLVGPRPERPVFVRRLSEACQFYDQRLVVRPGCTGWAQIKAPYAASVEESLEKLEYDLFYIKNLSVFLDLSILASTLRIVLLGRGAR